MEEGRVELTIEEYNKLLRKVDSVTTMELEFIKKVHRMDFRWKFTQRTLTYWAVFLTEQLGVSEKISIRELIDLFNEQFPDAILSIHEKDEQIVIVSDPRNPRDEEEYVERKTKNL